MKLLFDQNLSHKLVGLLQDVFPQSDHVRNVGLGKADDDRIWEYAFSNEFVVVAKDEDFYLLFTRPDSGVSAKGHLDSDGQLLDGSNRNVASAEFR